MIQLPVPDVPVRSKRPWEKHVCDCGRCKRCSDREASKRHYRRRKAGIAPVHGGPGKNKVKDIDMDQLNAYWERVKL